MNSKQEFQKILQSCTDNIEVQQFKEAAIVHFKTRAKEKELKHMHKVVWFLSFIIGFLSMIIVRLLC